MDASTPLSSRIRTAGLDAHVGSQVRLRRILMGMSQMALAEQIGLSFQQLQKYEKGVNRIGAGLLWRLAQLLDVPVSFFYVGIDDQAASAGRVDRMLLDFNALWPRLSERQRRAIFDVAKATAGMGNDGQEARP